MWIPISDLHLLAALESQIDATMVPDLDAIELRYTDPTSCPAPAAAPTRMAVSVAPGETGGPQPRVRWKLHRASHWVILAVALAVVVAGVPYFLRIPAQRRVTLDVDGASFTRTVRVDDVAGLLASAGLAVDPGDRITPAPNTTLRNGATVRVVRAFPITVEVDGVRRSVRTTATTVQALRRELRIPETLVAVDPTARLHRDTTVAFRTPLGGPLTPVAGTPTNSDAGLVTPGASVPSEVDEPVTAPRPQIEAEGTQPVGGANRQSGRATWYATLHQPGTCAHLHIPLGTIVRVVDIETGASATCRVADRGPEAWTDNIIDLAPDVFEQLQPLSSGVVHVRLEY